jgi:glycosyltransferase involved in cell wall biosynthesis
MPLVSIVTAVYNAARWLPETLASVKAQSFNDWEHLLIDDGSTDGSIAIVAAAMATDPRIRLLRTPQNSGPSAARNLGIESARGRFVAFLDADDLWLPDKLLRSVAWMTEHGYSFIYHDYRQISPYGERVGALIKPPDKLDLRTLHTRRGVGCLTVVIDREQIPVFRFPPPSPYVSEDFCLWAEILRAGHIGHRLPADLARYRLSPQSRSANKLRCAIDAWHLYRNFSKLPLAHAALWWTQYTVNALALHLNARPR